ncbi:MAG: lysylphosphatidylglycerol synthase domain-containing protein [Candidatus Binatia bacterium]
MAQALLGLLVVGLAIRSLGTNWNSLRTQPVEWRINVAWLFTSLVIIWGMYAALVEAWRRVVLGMQQKLGYWAAARICMVANLGRYIPGKIWSMAGAAVLAQRAGVAPGAALAAGAIIQALSLASGVLVVAALAPRTLQTMGPAVITGMVVAGGVAALGVLALTSPRAVGIIQRRLPTWIPQLTAIPPRATLMAFAVNAAAWPVYGAALLCLIRGLTPHVHLSWLQGTAAFAASYAAGLIAVFAPAGLGPRESVFVLLLIAPLGPKLAVALAIATRVLLTIAELGAAAPFLIVRRRDFP